MADTFDMRALKRVPLAEAVLLLWTWLCGDDLLDEIWQQHRGACHERVVTFPMIVQWVRDALLQPESSGNKSYHHAAQKDLLQGARSCYYDKLQRLPQAVSEAFLTRTSQRLQEIFPHQATHPLPASLQKFRLCVFDGKAIKNVPKRLLPLRQQSGGILGGKGLANLDLGTGLVAHLATHPDGETNDAKLFPAAWQQAVQGVDKDTVILAIADRQFCDLTQPRLVLEAGHHFLVRYHPKTPYFVDETCPARTGVDDQGRTWTEDWGWLGSEKNPRRLYVRRITLTRGEGEEDVIVLTDLLDNEEYPATDLLLAYLGRWNIEHVFQEITEVFSLNRLISSSPQGTLFQLSFCLVLYNLIQVVRAYVAEGQGYEAQQISSEKLFQDVVEELIALNKMLEVEQIVELIRPVRLAAEMRAYLAALLHPTWSTWWLKAPKKKKKPPTKKTKRRDHTSVFRVLDKQRKLQKESSTPP